MKPHRWVPLSLKIFGCRSEVPKISVTCTTANTLNGDVQNICVLQKCAVRSGPSLRHTCISIQSASASLRSWDSSATPDTGFHAVRWSVAAFSALIFIPTIRGCHDLPICLIKCIREARQPSFFPSKYEVSRDGKVCSWIQKITFVESLLLKLILYKMNPTTCRHVVTLHFRGLRVQDWKAMSLSLVWRVRVLSSHRTVCMMQWRRSTCI